VAFDARALLQFTSNLTSSLDLSTVSSPLTYSKQFTFTQGSGLNASDRIWHDNRTLSASNADSLDLAGVLTDPFGATISFVRVKGLLVYANTSNTNNLLVGAGTNSFSSWMTGTTPTVVVKPGGLLFVMAPDAVGYTVTAGTADILTITNSAGGTSVNYDIVVMGAST
jgi:hypothetical protein